MDAAPFAQQPLIIANIAWPGTVLAFGFVASQIIRLGLLFEWFVVWKVFSRRPGRAAVAVLAANLVSAAVGIPLTYFVGGVVGGEASGALGWLAFAALLSAGIEVAVLDRSFAVKPTARGYAWMASANIISCVIVTALFMAGR